MQATDQPILRDIVLIGGGHSHVGVLKSFAMKPMLGVRLTLISPELHTPYSGMLPGYVAGHYGFDDVHIDLLRLAHFAGARLYQDEAVGIDRAGQKVICKHRPPVPYDQLSINIGSTPHLSDIAGAAAHGVAVKPIRSFHERWLSLMERVKNHDGSLRIAVVGAGAGGVELVLAMQYRFTNELTRLGRPTSDLKFCLITGSPSVLPTHCPGVQARVARILSERGVQVQCNAKVKHVNGDCLHLADGGKVQAEEIIWVTRAGGAAWLKNTHLQLDADGFVNVNDTLQTVSDPLIFAAGDIANMVNVKLEKAGVFAVRMAGPLAENLRRAVSGQALQTYRPQKRWLALISTGDGYAVASRGRLHCAGHWVWRWKDWIDQRFMRRFNELPPLATAEPAASSASSSIPLNAHESMQIRSAIAMRCGGCAAKVGATILQRAIADLHPVQRSDVLIGLKQPDDAAVVRVPPGMAVVHSVDFFRSFIDDPYIFGKIAANHALGDLWAMGAQAQSATAICTVPPGIDAKVQDVLFQMMAGALEVLNDANCTLVGGHTGEGKELALGFAVNGLIEDDPRAMLRKSGMQPGDALILTKPLGTGTLLAAKDRRFAKGRWIEAALQYMMQSNRMGAQVLAQHGATACTDVTGFGLLGHALEMARASHVDVCIDLSALPLLAGAQECVNAGITSSLHSANARMSAESRNPQQLTDHPRYPLLFDPQTAGGLLASVPADRMQACVAALRAAGYPDTKIIGRIQPQAQHNVTITLS